MVGAIKEAGNGQARQGVSHEPVLQNFLVGRVYSPAGFPELAQLGLHVGFGAVTLDRDTVGALVAKQGAQEVGFIGKITWSIEHAMVPVERNEEERHQEHWEQHHEPHITHHEQIVQPHQENVYLHLGSE